MTQPIRVERTDLCPFCGQPVESADGRASLTLKRADGCLVHWKIHEQCFAGCVTSAATERL
jgi:hypothetical protein